MPDAENLMKMIKKIRATKKGVLGRDWFAIVFSIAIGMATFLWFVPLSYGGQKVITQKIDDQHMQLDANQELRILLGTPLFLGVSSPDDFTTKLVDNKATFADLIDMMGYDIQHRQQYFDILHDQVYSYFNLLGNPSYYRLKVAYAIQPEGDFPRPTTYATCYDASFCILANEPQGETLVGEVVYPSIIQGQVITVRLVRAKRGHTLPPEPQTPASNRTLLVASAPMAVEGRG